MAAAIAIERYTPAHKPAWDAFVAASKNGTFLLQRSYMDYHSDRFKDHSLLFFRKGKLVALLPANEAGDVIQSHGGLTYGGVISGSSMKVALMLEVFETMRSYFRARGLSTLTYKAIPHIYHRLPAEEDLYALFRQQAVLCRRDVSSAIDLQQRLPYAELRQRKLKQAAKSDIVVAPSDDFETFMQIEEQLLESKYNTRPVHTAAELRRLALLFPENIRLHAAACQGAMVAGVIIYETEQVAHCQYIATTAEGRVLNALDALVHELLTHVYPHKKYFNFGISTEQQGQYLNQGLISNKESYGARAVVQDFYELTM
ncbi:GNAT family N-acetyltransferase [Pontibacter beigongshangensis]|uniref:GNAT family N-acetyltransferase n=1 Tax=Pontibacter beigongshangensis TaxID=2574733 RepID=UPI00293BC1FF|nr:GNAT family N-acetyltransferase [Pontibacter beigongshangensis]